MRKKCIFVSILENALIQNIGLPVLKFFCNALQLKVISQRDIQGVNFKTVLKDDINVDSTSKYFSNRAYVDIVLVYRGTTSPQCRLNIEIFLESSLYRHCKLNSINLFCRLNNYIYMYIIRSNNDRFNNVNSTLTHRHHLNLEISLLSTMSTRHIMSTSKQYRRSIDHNDIDRP